MKIHKACKVEAIASDDARRYAICEAHLTVKDGAGTLVSTNGAAMAIIPVLLDEGDVSGYVSENALKLARKQDKQSDFATVYLNSVAKLSDGSTMPREGTAKDATFPKWEQGVPKDESLHVQTIAFDAKLLWELAQAMGTQGVILRVKDGVSAILVSPTATSHQGWGKPACDSAKGVLMPIRIL